MSTYKNFNNLVGEIQASGSRIRLKLWKNKDVETSKNLQYKE